jgi:small subunit ribosomal protein S16
MLKIRLARVGRKKKPSYRVVVADSRAPRDGDFIEIIGQYNPLTDPATIAIDEEKVRKWIGQGAQPTERVAILLNKLDIIEKPTKKYTERLARKIAGETAPKPARRKAKEPAKATKAKPAKEPAAEAAEAPATEPAAEEVKAEATAEPVAETTEEVVEKPAEAVEEPEAEKAEETPEEPKAEAVTEESKDH